MTETQVVLLHLLKEIDLLCKEQKISYCFINRLAWDALKFHRFHDKTYDAYIAIKEVEARGFIAAVNKAHDNREIEEYFDDGLKYIRYIDRDTTLIDLNALRRFNCPGIAVTIMLLQDSEIDSSSFDYSFDGKNFAFKKNVFFPTAIEVFEDFSFPVPAELDVFFSQLVSKDWLTKKYTGSINREGFSSMTDLTLPYSGFSKMQETKNLLGEANPVERLEYTVWAKKMDPLKASIKKTEQFRKRSFDRFCSWSRYYPKLPLIYEALMEQNYPKLEKTLSGFIDKVDEYCLIELGFSFDKMILEAAKPIIRVQKGQTYLDRYLSLIPREYDEDVTDLLLRKKVKHPFFDKVPFDLREEWTFLIDDIAWNQDTVMFSGNISECSHSIEAFSMFLIDDATERIICEIPFQTSTPEGTTQFSGLIDYRSTLQAYANQENKHFAETIRALKLSYSLTVDGTKYMRAVCTRHALVALDSFLSGASADDSFFFIPDFSDDSRLFLWSYPKKATTIETLWCEVPKPKETQLVNQALIQALIERDPTTIQALITQKNLNRQEGVYR
jgi:hypothetical protein